jgi:capsular exopolysaccharide synthesis family protein
MHYLQLLKRWWWLIVLATALGGGAGYVVSQRQPPIYEASATLIVTASTPSPNPADGLIPDQRASLVKTYKELLLKRPVLEAVIADLSLATDVETLAKQLSVAEVRDTQLLVLTAQDPDPQQAAAIANAAVQAFNRQSATLLANPYAANRAGLSVVEAAAPPRLPKGPGPLRAAIIAALVGTLLALGLAFAIEYFDTSVRSARDVALLTDLAIVAEVASYKGRRSQSKLVTLAAPFSPAAEVYRMMRLHLEASADDGPIRTVIVTSARPGEGKTITAANLAVALAQTGLRTVLIDTNLRRPSVHELFQQPNLRGVTTAMRPEEAGRAYEHTVDSGVENLRLLLSGPFVDAGRVAPMRFLVPQRVLRLVDEFKQHADIQIFDSPSALDVMETALLARSCDAVLLVVQARRTSAEWLLQARELMARSRSCILGVVLNRVARPSAGLPGTYYLERSSLVAPSAPAPWAALPAPGGSGFEPAPRVNARGNMQQKDAATDRLFERERHR